MGFKDVHTLINVMKSKATGELQDDKTYLMEQTIQVRHVSPSARFLAHGILACQWLAHKVKNTSRFDQCLYRRALELFTASAHVLPRRQVPVQAGRWFKQRKSGLDDLGPLKLTIGRTYCILNSEPPTPHMPALCPRIYSPQELCRTQL